MQQGIFNFFRSNSGDLLRRLDGTKGVVFDLVNLQIGGAEESNSITTKNPPVISLADFAKDKDAALVAMQGTPQNKINGVNSKTVVATVQNGAITTPETVATVPSTTGTITTGTATTVADDSAAVNGETNDAETEEEIVAPTNAPGSTGTVTPIVSTNTQDYRYPSSEPSNGYESNYGGYGGINTMTMIGIGAVVVLLIVMIMALMTR